MKKVLSIGVLTLASLWLTPGASSAGGTFGYFTQASCWPFNCCAGCKCCSSTLCIKPYNAFSPTCSGTMYCDGFCPLGSPPGYGSPQCALPIAPFGSLPSVGSCCEDPTTSSAAPAAPGAFEAQRISNPPAPLPAVNTSGFRQNPVASYGPMQIGYTYPAYAPSYNYVQPMAVPYYWNSNGR
jgi:hypothetical protein